MKTANRIRLFAVLLAGLSLPAMATTRTGQGRAPCNGIVQACIDGSTNGDCIDIASNGPINEDLSLYERSLTLRAANGFHPE